MQPGEIDDGVIAGLEGAADWVDDARDGLIDPDLLLEQLHRVEDHLTTYLTHPAAIGHPRRQRWLEALQTAEGL